MKKMIVIFVLLAAVCGQMSSSWAQSQASKVAVVKRGDIVRVIYAGNNPSTVVVSIFDADGNKVFAESLKGRRFLRPYNFSELPKGDYVLTVADESKEHAKKISHRNKTWVARIAKVRGADKKYVIAIPRQPNNNVMIHIYDQQDRLVLSESGKYDEDFARIYNLKDLEGATIQLVNQYSGEERFFKTE